VHVGLSCDGHVMVQIAPVSQIQIALVHSFSASEADSNYRQQTTHFVRVGEQTVQEYTYTQFHRHTVGHIAMAEQ